MIEDSAYKSTTARAINNLKSYNLKSYNQKTDNPFV